MPYCPTPSPPDGAPIEVEGSLQKTLGGAGVGQEKRNTHIGREPCRTVYWPPRFKPLRASMLVGDIRHLAQHHCGD